jgi:hypothetical protein
MHAFLLAFTLCGSPDPAAPSERCESGTITARTCEAAERAIRSAVQPWQTLHLSGCTRQVEVATR